METRKLSDLSKNEQRKFLSARFVHFYTGHTPMDRKKRATRLHRWTHFMHLRMANRMLDKFAPGMRNARKQERRAS